MDSDYGEEDRPSRSCRSAPQKADEWQKAIVTGASSGIGRAVASAPVTPRRRGREPRVRREDRRRTLEQIESCGTRADAHRADVSDEVQVTDMFGRCAEFGTLDIPGQQCAGLQQDDPLEEMTLRSGTRS